MPGIDKSQMVPIYHQLTQILRQKIDAGEWRPGDLIPSEREFCDRYGISRMTVRQAILELVNEGRLKRERGRGTFVAAPKMAQRLNALTSFTEDMAARGKRAEARVLRQELVPADPEVAAALQMAPGQPVLLLERLRLADGEPVALETCHLHFPGAERLLAIDLGAESLYAVLRRDFGLGAARANQSFEAGIAQSRPMEVLGLAPASAVLLTTRTTFSPSGEPFEHTRAVYRADRYAFHAELVQA